MSRSYKVDAKFHAYCACGVAVTWGMGQEALDHVTCPTCHFVVCGDCWKNNFGCNVCRSAELAALRRSESTEITVETRRAMGYTTKADPAGFTLMRNGVPVRTGLSDSKAVDNTIRQLEGL